MYAMVQIITTIGYGGMRILVSALIHSIPHLFVSIYNYVGIPMEGDILLCPFLKNKQKTKTQTTICQRGSGLLLGSRVIPLANPSGKAAPFRSILERLMGESRWTAWARCEGVLPRGVGLGWCWAS